MLRSEKSFNQSFLVLQGHDLCPYLQLSLLYFYMDKLYVHKPSGLFKI